MTTLTLTLDQAEILFHLATLTEDRDREDQDTILVLARFLAEHSVPTISVEYITCCSDPITHANHTWETGRPDDAS